jgi:hypothetical protein
VRAWVGIGEEGIMAHEHHKECCGERKLNRRAVLRVLGQVALAPAALVAAGSASAATNPILAAQQVTVFRLSPVPRGVKARRNVCCNACHLHSQNKYFATREAANLNRAHRGCNCAIVEERITLDVFNRMFLPIPALGNRLRRVEFDLRWA